ncbi:MAG TPA: hypothetical protein VIG64_04605 [Actinomycetota bacterium]
MVRIDEENKESGGSGTPAASGKPGTQAVTLRVSRDVYEAMRTHAFATNTTINDIATRALYNYLIDEGREKEIDAFLDRARKQYRDALDKLGKREP